MGSEHQVGAQACVVICQLLPDTHAGSSQQHTGSLEAGWQRVGVVSLGDGQDSQNVPLTPTPRHSPGSKLSSQ